jgi:hypothetical protein
MRGPRDTSAFRIPQPPAPPVKSEAFAQYPPALLEGLTEEEKASRQELYQRALQEAQAVARMSLPERNLLGSSN